MAIPITKRVYYLVAPGGFGPGAFPKGKEPWFLGPRFGFPRGNSQEGKAPVWLPKVGHPWEISQGYWALGFNPV